LLSLFNYEGGGWVIISSDKRTDPVLASRPTGELTFEGNENGALRMVIEAMTQNIWALRASSDKSEDEATLDMWTRVESKFGYRQKKDIEPLTKDYYDEYGNLMGGPYWIRELVSVTPVDSVIEDIGHLMMTKWGQEEPWNTKIVRYERNIGPIIDTLNCPVGCAPVAAGQILYYLHYYLGKPNGLYHTIVPESIILPILPDDQYYSGVIIRDDYNANSSRWDQMPMEYSLWGGTGNAVYVADFLSDLAHRMQTIFSNHGSETTGPNVLYAFSTNGITYSSSTTYNLYTVYNNISSGLPVFYGAEDSGGDGHAIVMDGWRRHYRHYLYTYHWTLVREGEVVQVDNDTYFGYIEGKALNPNDAEYTYVYQLGTNILHKVLVNWGKYGNEDDIFLDAATVSNVYDGVAHGTYPTYNQNPILYYGFN
ncbi:MAG: C10 family peptidase, partial [Bacteroidales bacterium]|nr:C10 family peptidase [Bacteroidales bacterium]